MSTETNETTPTGFHSGFVAIIGRPNSGKSTLLNAVLGEQLAIVSPMPQTTQRNMRGIYNEDNLQIVFVDTPGIHKGKHQLNHEMYNISTSMLKDSGVDLVCYIVDMSREFGEEEDDIAARVAKSTHPVIILFNKVDQITLPEALDKQETFRTRYPDLAAYPQLMLSALNETCGEVFIDFLRKFIPEGPQFYPSDDLTDASLRFFAAEYIRKEIIGNTHEEVPHASYVEIMGYTETETGHEITADIHVESSGQKAIIIGNKGATISKIRKGAEWKMRGLTGVKCKINLFVKVTKHWRDKKNFLKEAGFSE